VSEQSTADRTEATPRADNHLVSAPIGRLVRQLAIPASVGFFFNTLYNVVDTYFAGLLSTEALAALSLSFPVFFTLIATGSGFSTGATALIGQALGAGDRREAALTAAQGLVLSVLVTVSVMVLGYLVTPALFRLLGAEGSYLDLCLQYIRVILAGCGFVYGVYMLNGILNAQGDTRSFRDFLMIAAAANVVLDPLLMFGWLGLPALGVGGIALATVIAQSGGVVFLAWRVRRTGLLARGQGVRWRPHRPTLVAIVQQGVPASLNMMSVAIGIFIITWFLGRVGQEAVAAYGVATRIEQIILLPTIGLNVAALTLAAQNAGAGLYDRVRQAVRTALLYGALVATVGAVAMFLAARPLMDLFTDDPAVVAIGAHYLRIAAFLEYAYVLLFVNGSALQGLKRPQLALWLGLFRQVVAPVTFFWLTTEVLGLGLPGIWWTIFAVNWIAALVAVRLARREVDRLEARGTRPAVAA
jgi:putative MATE family efflux protein